MRSDMGSWRSWTLITFVWVCYTTTALLVVLFRSFFIPLCVKLLAPFHRLRIRLIAMAFSFFRRDVLRLRFFCSACCVVCVLFAFCAPVPWGTLMALLFPYVCALSVLFLEDGQRGDDPFYRRSRWRNCRYSDDMSA